MSKAQDDLRQMGTDLQNAINMIKNGDPSDVQVQQAAAFINETAVKLQNFDLTHYDEIKAENEVEAGSGTTENVGADEKKNPEPSKST